MTIKATLDGGEEQPAARQTYNMTLSSSRPAGRRGPVTGGVPESDAAWRTPGGDYDSRDPYISGRDTGTSRKFSTTRH